MRRRLTVAVAAFAAAIALAACGEDDSPEESGPPAAVQEDGPGGKLVIEAEDGAFNAQAVYDRAAPGVVTITAVFAGNETSILGETGPRGGQGSGFVISEDGEIATNAHVVTDAEAVTGSDPSATPAEINTAREVFVQFPDRNSVPAEIVGFDPFGDVALVKVDPDGLDLQPVELGSIGDIEVGEPVAAIGSPFGEQQSLSVGVVSALDRSIPSLTQFQIDGAIQTDASINPGNSGGPLLDAEGRVVGINQQIDTTSGGNQGVGFAVPIDLASRSLDQLREDGEVDYAYIGITTQALFPQLAEELDLGTETGALIANLIEGGPADEADLCCVLSKSEEREKTIRFQAIPVVTGGDVIISVDGEKLVGATDLPRIISRKEPGQTVTLEIIRDGDRMEVDVKLEARPAS